MRTLTAMMLLLVGCDGAAIDDDASVDLEEAIGKDDSYNNRPYGTFRASPGSAGDFSLLVLMTDRAFHREQVVTCITFPCDPIAADGKFIFTKSGSYNYIRFYNADGSLLDRYAWKLHGDTLSLRLVNTSRWFHLQRSSPAWCGDVADCEAQNLAVPRCIGRFSCQKNACAFKCGFDRNPCEVAGGACVGLTPNNCKDGVVGDASKFSCGGPVGVMCCLPPSACKPVCGAVGTRSEGWYDGCSGKLHCYAKCSGATVSCGAVGTRSEGWYAKGAGCLGGDLIGWSNCGK